MGTECHYFICDVGNREEVYQTAKAVREKVRAGPELRWAQNASLRDRSHPAWHRAWPPAEWLFPGCPWGLSASGPGCVCVRVRGHECVTCGRDWGWGWIAQQEESPVGPLGS